MWGGLKDWVKLDVIVGWQTAYGRTPLPDLTGGGGEMAVEGERRQGSEEVGFRYPAKEALR